MDIVSSFFFNLADRRRKENDLSDITWAMCQTIPAFQKAWLDFFFKDFDLDAILCIEREFYAEKDCSSRVDFYIESSKDPMPFIIEVKINDRGHHFEQYIDAFGVDSAHFGYITNYPCQQPGFVVHQWKEFSDFLANKCYFSDDESKMVVGYLDYLKNVCYMDSEIELINLGNMRSLYDITRLFKQLSNAETGYYSSSFYKDYTNDASKYSAMTVKYNAHPEWGNVFPIMGVWFNPPYPRICAGFFKDSGWGKQICKFLDSKRTKFSLVKSELCSNPIKDEGYFFYLSKKAQEDFNQADTVDVQRDILRQFLDEVVSYPILLEKAVNEDGR